MIKLAVTGDKNDVAAASAIRRNAIQVIEYPNVCPTCKFRFIHNSSVNGIGIATDRNACIAFVHDSLGLYIQCFQIFGVFHHQPLCLLTFQFALSSIDGPAIKACLPKGFTGSVPFPRIRQSMSPCSKQEWSMCGPTLHGHLQTGSSSCPVTLDPSLPRLVNMGIRLSGMCLLPKFRRRQKSWLQQIALDP